jgi:hypothetical protein
LQIQRYTKPEHITKAPTIDCDASDLDKPAKAAGMNIIACAKMIGITPEALSFEESTVYFHPAYPVQNHLTLYDEH